MVINRELGREERHEEFGEEIGLLQYSLKEGKDRGLGFFYFFYILIPIESINKIETLYQCSIKLVLKHSFPEKSKENGSHRNSRIHNKKYEAVGNSNRGNQPTDVKVD